MNKFKTFMRGWLAVSFVQQFGLVMQHIRDPSILHKTFSTTRSNDILSGQFFIIICVQQAILKGFLLIDNTNWSLHFYHIIVNIFSLLFFTWKAYSGQAPFTVELLSQGIFSGISIILTLLYLTNMNSDQLIPEAKSKPRKLISKHYLEAHVSDYDPQKRKDD